MGIMLKLGGRNTGHQAAHAQAGCRRVSAISGAGQELISRTTDPFKNFAGVFSQILPPESPLKLAGGGAFRLPLSALDVLTAERDCPTYEEERTTNKQTNKQRTTESIV
jgi:hypothetical protein